MTPISSDPVIGPLSAQQSGAITEVEFTLSREASVHILVWEIFAPEEPIEDYSAVFPAGFNQWLGATSLTPEHTYVASVQATGFPAHLTNEF